VRIRNEIRDYISFILKGLELVLDVKNREMKIKWCEEICAHCLEWGSILYLGEEMLG